MGSILTWKLKKEIHSKGPYISNMFYKEHREYENITRPCFKDFKE